MGENRNTSRPVDPRQVFVISGPSGVGKNTIAESLCRQGRAVRVVTATTRPPKEGESEGRDYFFVSREEFERRVRDGRMAEHADYLGHYYGTPLNSVNRAAQEGLPVLLTIEVHGAQQIKKRWPEATLIFVAPPSEEELRKRLRDRDRDDDASVERRLRRARQEAARVDKYDFRVVNDVLEEAVETIAQIIARLSP